MTNHFLNWILLCKRKLYNIYSNLKGTNLSEFQTRYFQLEKKNQLENVKNQVYRGYGTHLAR